MCNFIWYVFNIVLCLSILLELARCDDVPDDYVTARPKAKVCGDIRITLFELRSGFGNRSLSTCEICLGSITYAPMFSTLNFSTPASIHFPNLREVYGYVLLGYSTAHSFSTVFPRLSIIHGRELYLTYSLIVINNFFLEELGLTSLINIRRGNVIIARNTHLCYAKTISWNDIIQRKSNHVILRQNRGNCAFCPTCSSTCWSATQCQQKCSTACPGNCLSEAVCCPEQCIGGCHYDNATIVPSLICNACKNMRIYSTGVCVEECPLDTLKTGSSLCVTREECTSLFLGTGFVLEEINECVASCPAGFISLSNSSCVRCMSSPENDYCNEACREKHIRSVADFRSVKYCSRMYTLNIYNIEIVESKGVTQTDWLSAFESLEQVDHEFTIHNVKIFSTLGIFSRLRRIGTTPNSSTIIEENEFLAELWPSKQQQPLIEGTLNIVRNGHLCPTHIKALVNYTKTYNNELQVTSDTLNEYANGYMTSCESVLLNIHVRNISSSAALINVAIPIELFLNPSSTAKYVRRPFLSLYYKPVQAENETRFDLKHSRKWLRVIEKVNYNSATHARSFIMGVQLTPLLGYQLYAVYASLTSNLHSIGLYSPIAYFRTLEGRPEPIHNLRGESLSTSSVQLIWEPPSKSNGPITTYLIYYAPMEDRLPMHSSKSLCSMRDRWQPEAAASTNDGNPIQLTQCSQTKSNINIRKANDNIDSIDTESDEDIDEDTRFDQIVTDLSIVEYQLINSISQRKDPLPMSPELKDTIIRDLDDYFDGNVSQSLDNKIDLDEETIREHKPDINQYNQTTSNTRIIISNLREAQMYMFQIYACHDLSRNSLSKACSLSGVIVTVRTKPGASSHDVVRNVQLSASVDDPHQQSPNQRMWIYQISWLPPLRPNGPIYYYVLYIWSIRNNGSEEEFCIGYDTNSMNVTLLPGTTYRIRIVTFTIARLNNEYGDIEQINTAQISLLNLTNQFFQVVFTTSDLPSGRLIRQDHSLEIIILIGLTIILIFIVISVPLYCYKYLRGDTNDARRFPRFLTVLYDGVNDRVRTYTAQHEIL